MAFGSLSRSWQLFRVSWSVLRKDKEILVLPVAAGAAVILLWMGLLAPVFLFSLFGGLTGAYNNWVFWVLVVVFYVVSYFIAIFFNAAIIGCATIRLNGGDPTVRDGLRVASSRMGSLFVWAVIAGLVGLLISLFRRRMRGSFAGSLIAGFLGMAWYMATIFVIPSILYENERGFGAIKRSVRIIRSTLGETFVSQFTLQIVGFLFGLLGVGMLIGGVFVTFTYSLFWGMLIIAAAIVYLVFVAVLFSALHGILVAALYRYARTGSIGMGYEHIVHYGRGVPTFTPGW